MQTILLGRVGSHSYGLAHAGSDVDRLGVFAAPTLDVAGLDWHTSKESKVKQGPEGDDIALHEVGKFVRLSLKANPTILELLALPDEFYETRTDDGARLVSIREAFYSRKAVWNAYHGYATAQIHKYANGFPKAKYIRHAMRLIEQGRILYETGTLQVQVENRDRYFALSDMTHDQAMRALNADLDAWQETGSPLPEEPNRDTVRDFLSDVRRNHMED